MQAVRTTVSSLRRLSFMSEGVIDGVLSSFKTGLSVFASGGGDGGDGAAALALFSPAFTASGHACSSVGKDLAWLANCCCRPGCTARRVLLKLCTASWYEESSRVAALTALPTPGCGPDFEV